MAGDRRQERANSFFLCNGVFCLRSLRVDEVTQGHSEYMLAGTYSSLKPVLQTYEDQKSLEIVLVVQQMPMGIVS